MTPTVGAADKLYDGTTAATITSRSLTGVLGSDDVSLSGGTATFDSAAAGTGKTVTVTGLTLSGAAADKYMLTSFTATTTADITAIAPTVTTTTPSAVTAVTATSGGAVTSDGGTAVTARGVCWSTSATPTTADSHTTNSTGTGAFNSSIAGLSENTTYYVRAYATNSVGTSYGADLTFTTTFTVSFVTDGTAGASLTGTASQSVPFDGGTTAVTAHAPAHFHFVNWTFSSGPSSISNPLTLTSVQGSITATANFAIDTYTLGYAAGAHGAITGAAAQTVDYGHDGSAVTAVPDTGYHFVAWSDGVLTATRTDAGVTGDLSVTAAFAIDTHAIDASAGAHGAISPSGTQAVDYGADQTYDISADAHYRVADVLVDGVSVGAVSSYTFTGVTSAHTISASFAVDTNLITASADPHGTISPSGTRAIDYGADQTYIMSADAHYRIADVLVDGVSVGAMSAYTFSGVTAGHTIAVTFAPTDPPVTRVKGLPSGWVGRTVKLSLVAVHTADGAPVAYTKYRVGSGGWTRGTTVVVKRQGVTLVTYRSVDTAGNVEVAKTCSVRIDTTAPAVVVGNEVNVNRGDVASFPYRLRDNLAKSLDCRLVITWHGKVVAVKRLGQRPVGRRLVVKMRCALAVHGADAYGWRIEARDAAGNRAAATGGELEVWLHWFGEVRH